MVITITRKVVDEIRLHAEASYPEECCGLLIADGKKHITESLRVKNVFDGPRNNRYHINPLDLYRADRETAQRGMTIAGIYHSHPDYPAVLSRFDLDHSFPWYSYIVVSVANGKASDTKSWVPKEDHTVAAEEKIELVED